ncbi:hypothetical protein GUJ93_ZPchr0008g11717 [Zizania palustris]|uniref:Uncharacterized protein n=1 Tax=Zizania palustris TaxID=103762 RepID=A0A8J5UWZ7_ZIZPA|nr:hypothetical protein GUJ93_ZPchr0008g11717 [Zizania palustris]
MESGLAASHRRHLSSVAAPAATHLLLRRRVAESAAATTTTPLRLPRHLPTLTAADSAPPISHSMLGRGSGEEGGRSDLS